MGVSGRRTTSDKTMLNFNQSDPNIVNANFSCQMDGPADPQQATGPSNQSSANPSAYSSATNDQPSYPLMANFNARTRNSSPDRYFDHTIHDSVHQTPDTIFPFVMPSCKGSENVKRFSVNNLLQLAQCTSATNLLSSARALGE